MVYSNRIIVLLACFCFCLTSAIANELYNDKELRDLLAKNWPHWGEQEITLSIKNEADNIKRANPNFSQPEINQAVKDLWIKRVEYKNNPASRPGATTYAAKKGFTGPLAKIDNESELAGACVAIANTYLKNSRGTSFDTRGVGQYSSCVTQRNLSDTTFQSGLKKWTEEFNSTMPYILQIYMDQCVKGVTAWWVISSGKCL